MGGFILPFLSVGAIGIVLSICLLFAIPDEAGEMRNDEETENATKKISFLCLLKVI